MPGVAKQGDMSSGHGGFPPRTGISSVSDVFINGSPVHVHGDVFAVHSDGNSAHGGTAIASGHIFCHGKPVLRIGDPISCGGVVTSASGNVFG